MSCTGTHRRGAADPGSSRNTAGSSQLSRGQHPSDVVCRTGASPLCSASTTTSRRTMAVPATAGETPVKPIAVWANQTQNGASLLGLDFRLFLGTTIAFPVSRGRLAQTVQGRVHRPWLSGSAHIPHCGPPWRSPRVRKLREVVPDTIIDRAATGSAAWRLDNASIPPRNFPVWPRGVGATRAARGTDRAGPGLLTGRVPRNAW